MPELRPFKAVEFLGQPWDHGRDAGRQLEEQLVQLLAKIRRQTFSEEAKARRQELDEAAAAGSKAAFLYVKANDVEGGAALSAAGTGHVLDENFKVWCGHWNVQHDDTEEDSSWLDEFPEDVPIRAASAADIRTAAAAFAPTTACPDGLPAQALASLSDPLMDGLVQMALLWEASLTWPSSETEVITVLIPKATGGERPIALFRTIVRVLAKAKAWQARGWLRSNSPHYVNMAAGRRVGDALWRTQLRALIDSEEGEHAAEFMLDLQKAFELVRRGLLVSAAKDSGYPCDVLAWGMSMYDWKRRLSLRGCASKAVFARIGIAAGSAFATSELWLLLASSLGRLTRAFPLCRWCLHVDDLSCMLRGRSANEIAEVLGKVYGLTKRELEEKCGMRIAPGKTA